MFALTVSLHYSYYCAYSSFPFDRPPCFALFFIFILFYIIYFLYSLYVFIFEHFIFIIAIIVLFHSFCSLFLSPSLSASFFLGLFCFLGLFFAQLVISMFSKYASYLFMLLVLLIFLALFIYCSRFDREIRLILSIRYDVTLHYF